MSRLTIFIFILLLSWPTFVFAQDLKGVVKDVNSRLPIENAQIISLKATVLTNKKGEFKLENVNLDDRIAIRIMGYETVELTLQKLADTLRIYLRQDPFALKEIIIKGKRNYKLDSLNLRKEYAREFAYKGPSFSDMFIGKVPKKNDYVPSFANGSSTASLVSLNLLQVASLFGKKKSRNTKLKETLLRDEELNYVDHVFSKDKIKLLTGLEGEALIKFMNLYRPSILTLKKMTGYELTVYIKKCYVEFAKGKL
ncbi:hypothetical protein WG904_06340 [Pedobacter sp. Du54]|uniref:carboxypeptidase-like regulatory domain-containing protein n=1 Tax=Pedobacter anseongensis TaxID=3133439 RepID=UPI003099C312